MSATAETPASAGALEWRPLLFVRYREGKKQRTADLRGPEWPSSLASVLDSIAKVEKRLWTEQQLDVGVRGEAPVCVRIVRGYDGRTGTTFIPWGDVLTVEYEGEGLSLGEAFVPPPQRAR